MDQINRIVVFPGGCPGCASMRRLLTLAGRLQAHGLDAHFGTCDDTTAGKLEDERAAINTQLADLAKTDAGPGDPALLDALPTLGDRLHDAPARLQQQLYDAFDLQALYKKNMHQVTLHVTITDSTPRAVAAIINDADGHPGTPPQTPPDRPRFRIWHKPL